MKQRRKKDNVRILDVNEILTGVESLEYVHNIEPNFPSEHFSSSEAASSARKRVEAPSREREGREKEERAARRDGPGAKEGRRCTAKRNRKSRWLRQQKIANSLPSFLLSFLISFKVSLSKAQLTSGAPASLARARAFYFSILPIVWNGKVKGTASASCAAPPFTRRRVR